VNSAAELVVAAHRNYIGSFRKLVEHSANGELHAVGQTIVLQATEMGLPVYYSMGFRTVARYAMFTNAHPHRR
jgi:methanogenic corrinoid protein MtbC1